MKTFVQTRAIALIKNSKLGLLCLTASILFLSGCTADQRSKPTPPEINTYKAYLEDSKVKHAVYTSDEVSVRTLADYSTPIEGFELAIELNTNEDKQGFEYIAYVKGFPSNENKNELHLLPLDKSRKGASKKLAEITGTICGIKPKLMPSSYAFSDRGFSNRALKHTPEIILAVAESDDLCTDDSEVFYESLTFKNYLLATEDNEDESVTISPSDYFKRSIITRYEANAALVINYASSSAEEYGYLSNNPNAGVTFHYFINDESGSWQSDELNKELFIKQASDSEVLLYSDDGEVRVIKASTLLSVGDLDENSNIDTPVNKQVNAIFELPIATIEGGGSLLSTNTTPKSDVFTMNVDNELYFFNRNSLIDPPLIKLTNDGFPATGSTISSHEVFLDETIIMIAEDDSSKYSASSFNPESGSESSVFAGASADHMEMVLHADALFFNTRNLSGNVGWQTHELEFKDNNLIFETYENNSRLLNFPNLNEKDSELYLLGLNTLPTNHDDSYIVENPGTLLFRFDSNRSDGRYKKTSSVTKQRADFSYGWLLGLNLDDFNYEGTYINDEFVRFSLTYEQDSNTFTSAYIFEPVQTKPDLEFFDQTLRQVSFTSN